MSEQGEKPLRLEKLTIRTFSWSERLNDALCLLKMAALVVLTGSAEISFDSQGKVGRPQPNVPGRRYCRRSDRRNVGTRHIERQGDGTDPQLRRPADGLATTATISQAREQP